MESTDNQLYLLRIFRIGRLSYFPKECLFCGSDGDLIESAVHLRTGFTKNNIKTQQSSLCGICHSLMLVCEDIPKYIMLGPIIGNKIVLRDFQLTQVFSDVFTEKDRIRERISFEITNHAIVLTKDVLFEFDEYTKDHELSFPTFYLRSSKEAAELMNYFSSLNHSSQKNLLNKTTLKKD